MTNPLEYMRLNDLSSAICDMQDIKRTIKRTPLWNAPKDNEGTEITVGECIEDVLMFLTELEDSVES